MFKKIISAFTLFACLSLASSSFAMLRDKEEQDEDTPPTSSTHLTEVPEQRVQYVSIEGLHPINVLHALWLGADRVNRNFGDEETQALARFFQKIGGAVDGFPREKYQKSINGGVTRFDYIQQRCLKVNFSRDYKTIKLDLYNREHGEGKGEKIIADLMRDNLTN